MNKESIIMLLKKDLDLCKSIINTFMTNNLELAFCSLSYRAKSNVISSVDADWDLMMDDIEMLLKNCLDLDEMMTDNR